MLDRGDEDLQRDQGQGERGHELAMQDKALEFEKLRGAQRMSEIGAAADGAWNTGAIETLRGNTMVNDLSPSKQIVPAGFEILQSDQFSNEWLAVQPTPGIEKILYGCAATYLTVIKNGQAIAWVIGWIEENKHPYFFVLQIEGPATVDLKKARLSVLNAILKEQGFFEGKR